MHDPEEAMTKNFARSSHGKVRFEHWQYGPDECRERIGGLLRCRNQTFHDSARVFGMT
jgi:hypothetical protein